MLRHQFTRKILGSLGQKSRGITTSAARSGGHHDIGGVPGANLPFDTHNRHKLAVYMAAYMGFGFATPFLLLRTQLRKKQ